MSDPLILTPGPVAVPDFVLGAVSRPVLPHRSAEFEAFYGNVLNRLRYLFQTEQSVCTLPGSGSHAVEMAMNNLFRPGETICVADMGKFSGRWADYGQTSGMEVIRWKVDWGTSVQVSQLEKLLEKASSLDGIVLTHCETSTAALIDLEEIALWMKQRFPECLVVVDAITSVGVLPFYMDEWGIDAAIVTGQKALMNPAGLSAIALSELARSRLAPHDPQNAFNLAAYVEQAERNSVPFTPPVQLLYGLDAALKYVQEQSLPILWNHSHQLGRFFRKNLNEMGAKIFSELPSDSLTAFSFPNQSHSHLQQQLLADHGIWLSGGQGKLKDHILRCSHMGMVQQGHLEKVLEALTRVR